MERVSYRSEHIGQRVYITISSQTTYHAPINATKAHIVNPIEQRVPQYFSNPVNAPGLVYRIDSGKSIETGTMRPTYLVKKPSKAGRILASPSSACSPLPMSVRLLYTHPAGLVERLTNYEAYDVVTPQSSGLNLIFCVPNGLGNVQTMKVNHPILTILRQREL